jgi:PilX N-terminal
MTPRANNSRCGLGGPGGQSGAALIAAMMCTLLLMALGAALILTTAAETAIAANYRDSDAAFFAADAMLERATVDLASVSDWNLLLGGVVRSAFIDGAPSGPRTLPGGSTIDLTQVTNILNCQTATACSAVDMDAVTADRPWGSNNPRWQLFAYGPLADMLPAGAINSPYYVVAFVADDASETDGDPSRDGVDPVVNPGSGVITVRAEAFGPRASHHVIEATVARAGTAGLDRGGTGARVLSWRDP